MQTEKTKFDPFLRCLDGEAFDLFHENFKADRTLEDDGKDYGRVKKALLEQSAKVADPQDIIREAIEAGLLSNDLPGSLQRLDRLYAREDLNKQAKFGLFELLS